jgi:TRAP-type C4-dicarboxylate transport system permease small subunit
MAISPTGPSLGRAGHGAVRRWLDGCERVVTLVAAAATFAMMLLTTADAAGRYLLNRPILAAYELTTNYLMVMAVFLAMPYAYRTGANIRVTFLVARLGRRGRLAVSHVVQIVSILYLAALVVATAQQAFHVWSTRTTFVTLDWPLWPAHLIVSAGLFVTALMMALDLPEAQRGRSSLFTGD